MFCFMQGKGDGLRIERSGLHDNWDDAEGYYSKYNISIWSSLCIYVVFPLYCLILFVHCCLHIWVHSEIFTVASPLCLCFVFKSRVCP